MEDIKSHWEAIYAAKQPHEMSWWQEIPKTSLEIIHKLHLSKSSRIIDIGGGDSTFAGFLLQDGFTDITVLDIAAKAIERGKHRLGPAAKKIHWIVNDVLDFHPPSGYDLWHDRAMFHFLTSEEQIAAYRDVVRDSLNDNGHIIIGTFSLHGPKRCSGLPTQQYDAEDLQLILGNEYNEIQSFTTDHITPAGLTQNFQFCCFQKIRVHP